MLETKLDVKKTALLLIDMQNDLIKAKEEPHSAVARMCEAKGMIDNTARVIDTARKAGIPVIYVGHVFRKDGAGVVSTITDEMLQGLMPPPKPRMIEGTAGANFVDEIKPASEDHIIHKRRSNAFFNTDLELMLRSRGIDTLIMAGAVTDKCIANSVRGARERDFSTIVLSDCCACMMPETDEYFMKKVFAGEGRVRTSKEVIAAINRTDKS